MTSARRARRQNLKRHCTLFCAGMVYSYNGMHAALAHRYALVTSRHCAARRAGSAVKTFLNQETVVWNLRREHKISHTYNGSAALAFYYYTCSKQGMRAPLRA